MRKVFNSQYKITQEFGVNKEYYSQFGLQGHEGIDLIPTGTVWDIYALEDGIVVLDDVVGSVSADPYGKIVTLWHPNIKKATMYCHLAENYVSKGQTVKRGEKIGKMGSTGNSTGAHLHLNLFEVDDNGTRLNKNNGFLGGINPKPFLEENVPDNSEPMVTLPQKEVDQLRQDRDTHYNDLQDEKKRNTQLTNDLLKEQEHSGELLRQLEKISEEERNTTEQLLDAQKKNKPLQDAILGVNRALGLMDDTDTQTMLKAIEILKESKVIKEEVPTQFVPRLKYCLNLLFS